MDVSPESRFNGRPQRLEGAELQGCRVEEVQRVAAPDPIQVASLGSRKGETLIDLL